MPKKIKAGGKKKKKLGGKKKKKLVKKKKEYDPPIYNIPEYEGNNHYIMNL